MTVTDGRVGGQCDDVGPSTPAAAAETPALPTDLDAVYRAHADFVHRTACQLGVPSGQVEDVMHDVFLVVHRRLPEFDGRASMTTWLYNIARGVAANHRRGRSREARRLQLVQPKPNAVLDPERQTEREQAARFVREFVTTLDDDKRMVFELADLEGMPVPEVAEICGIKLNTAYSRLRAARLQFRAAISRHHGGER